MSRPHDAAPMPGWLRLVLVLVAVANALVAVLNAYKGNWLVAGTCLLVAVVFAVVLLVDSSRRTGTGR